MRILKFLIKVSLAVILLPVIVFSLLMIAMQTNAFGGLPLIGDYKPLIVLSGSMEPAQKVGSVVIVGPADTGRITAGDIITFNTLASLDQQQSAQQRLTTHRVNRVIETGGRRAFETRGDANDDVDARLIQENEVVGQVVFSIPYLGYANHYLRSKAGLMALIIIAVGIIIIEVGRAARQLWGRHISVSQQ